MGPAPPAYTGGLCPPDPSLTFLGFSLPHFTALYFFFLQLSHHFYQLLRSPPNQISKATRPFVVFHSFYVPLHFSSLALIITLHFVRYTRSSHSDSCYWTERKTPTNLQIPNAIKDQLTRLMKSQPQFSACAATVAAFVIQTCECILWLWVFTYQTIMQIRLKLKTVLFRSLVYMSGRFNHNCFSRV